MFERHRTFALNFVLLSFIFVSRFQTFGNPLIHVDEEFYLFGGGRLLHGDLPYLQVWDRKPFGIFLLYAFFHLFGSYRILAYQTGAMAAVWGTAWLLFRMGQTIAPAAGAFMSALLYVALLNLSQGEGGQTPVFYNLPVAAAVALVLQALTHPERKHQDSRLLLAMLLFGLAMQLKYTVVFEGIFVGLYSVARIGLTYRSTSKAIQKAALFAIAGLLPTLAVFCFYVAIGHGSAWIFANLESIFLRGHAPDEETRHLQLRMLRAILPLMVGLIATAALAYQKISQPQYLYLTLWSCAACLGVLTFGGWYPHYALPLAAPLALTCAPLWYWRAGRAWMLALLCAVSLTGQYSLRKHRLENGDQQTFQAMLKVMSQKPGCVFVYQGPPALYDAPYWCPLTNHPFPGHFHEKIEAHATGMDVMQETRRVLAEKPAYIVTEDPLPLLENFSVRNEIFREIKASYTPVYRFRGRNHSIYIYRHI
ncbi:hypothetical protein BAR24_01230 [Gluconobacter oxydans]|uniref:glycosyltransferase family 39 protein n=1 Tax=Gluconobacter thailandicus TaxID=257438 RepID=UPI000299825E|nr:glycosyltransferase family 39 protein [Gluconobacter thailandicus]AFW01173.1 hypothetical protein B932_1594 [Gluconobacter oxydans H24]ANQ40197.1 hypothetical protein BAR24_01230 [Gluconobacter oxydans]